jgi:hypothetical protein
MTSVLMIAGLFAGIAVCLATLYSVAQAMLAEGWPRRAHLAHLAAILVVMGALLEREVTVARIGAAPLLASAVWVFWLERGWYRVFPLLVILFAAILMAGYVALSPLPGD